MNLPLPFINIFCAQLLDEQLELVPAVQILTFPSENKMDELFTTIDLEAILAVHKAILRCLTEEIADK